ncbi:MAG: TraR/DksA family transcriptional regulator [Myxococcales bacterium]|nr:TraR/DksA family transcriptional regulator [Myxococcales bacterium]
MSDHLSKAQIEQLRALLLAERAQFLATQTRPVADDAIGDVQDHAAEAARVEREVRLADHGRERLAEVEAALVRIEDQTYGVCEETGDPIPFARLLLEPTTRYTVDALEGIERERARDAVNVGDGGDDPAY